MTKIVIIDDHQLFLHGLKLTLENANNQVSVFDEAQKALIMIKQLQPDLIFTDLCMPEMDGLCLMAELKKLEVVVPVIVLSACEEYKSILNALQKGAMGFIPKYYAPQEMLDALQSVLSGEVFIPQEIKEQLNALLLEEQENRALYSLSPRQSQILSLIYEGKTNREMAELLSISADTVKFHQRGLYQVLQVSGVSSRQNAVDKALQVGLLYTHDTSRYKISKPNCA